MKKLIVCIMILLITCGVGFTDVIRLIDGKIYLGKVVGSEAGVSVIELGTEKKIVKQSDIMKTESDITALKNQSVDIVLKDGSILNGKIRDFDPDAGLLLDIAFGSLTIPFESINYISDPVQRTWFNGAPVKIGLVGGYYFGVGDMRSTFNDSFSGTFFAEINPNLARGLFTGISFSYINLNYAPNIYLSYLLINTQIYLSYRFLMFRTMDSFLNRFVPYISAGAGVAYINAYDSRDGFSFTNWGEISFSFSGNAGLDFFIIDNLLIKIDCMWISIVQRTSLFNTLSVSAGLALCF